MEGLNTYHVLPTIQQAAQKSGGGEGGVGMPLFAGGSGG